MKALKGRNKDYLVFWGTSLGYALFMFYLLSSFTKVRLFHNRFTSRPVAQTLYMGKWDLYTASPMATIAKLYSVKGKEVVPIDIRPFSSEYAFGLNRTPKLIAQEITAITKDSMLMHDAYLYTIQMPVNGDLNKFIGADTLHVNDVRLSNVTYLQGRYLITLVDPLTWQEQRLRMPGVQTTKVMSVNILRP